MWEVSHTKFKAYFNACIIIENPHAVKDLADFNFEAFLYTKAPQAVLSSPPYSLPRAALMNADIDRKSTRLNSSHSDRSRMPSSA